LTIKESRLPKRHRICLLGAIKPPPRIIEEQ
jgi:hypothetical protein